MEGIKGYSENALASTAGAAALGGAAEAMGGGKFANGAVTGAFVNLFNHHVHNMQKNMQKTELAAEVEGKVNGVLQAEKDSWQNLLENGSENLEYDVTIDGFENNPTGLMNEPKTFEVNIELDGETYRVKVRYSPSLTKSKNIVTSLNFAGRAEFMGHPKGLKGLYVIEFNHSGAANTHYSPMFIYADKSTYNKINSWLYGN